jgi:HAMP domain-containing protein
MKLKDLISAKVEKPAGAARRQPLAEMGRWMSLFESQTLSRKLLASLLPAVLILTGTMGIFSYYLGRRQILKNVQQEMEGLAQNAAAGLRTFFRQRLNDLESISETPLIADHHKNVQFGLLQEAEMYRLELRRYFDNFSSRAKVYDDIAYVSPTGRYIASLRASTAERWDSPSFATFLARMKKGKIHEAPLQPGGPGRAALIKRYAKPVFDEAGTFIGAVVVDCDMAHVEVMLKQLRIGTTGGAFLETQEGEPILGTRHEPGDYLSAIAAIEGTPWRVGVETPASDFLQPLSQIKYLTLIFTLFAGLLVIVVIVSRVSSLVGPIQRMVEVTQKFASGDLSHRMSEPETKELKTLAVSFNHMAANLEERNRQLEKRLRQLTALRDMEEAVIQRLDEDTILRTCVEAVALGFSFDRTALYWVDYGKKQIVGRFLYGSDAMGFTESSFRKRRIPLGAKDILNEVVSSREAVLVRDPGKDPRLNPEYVSETKTREFVVAPISGKDRVLGILAADNYYSGRALEESDREGLTLFANATGLALENSFLFQTLAGIGIGVRSCNPTLALE